MSTVEPWICPRCSERLLVTHIDTGDRIGVIAIEINDKLGLCVVGVLFVADVDDEEVDDEDEVVIVVEEDDVPADADGDFDEHAAVIKIKQLLTL